MFCSKKEDFEDPQAKFLSSYAENIVKILDKKIDDVFKQSTEKYIKELEVVGQKIKADLLQLSSIADQGKQQLSSIADQGKQQLSSIADQGVKKIEAVTVSAGSFYKKLSSQVESVNSTIKTREELAVRRVKEIGDEISRFETYIKIVSNQYSEKLKKLESTIKEYSEAAISAASMAKACAKEVSETSLKVSSIEDIKNSVVELQSNLALHLNKQEERK